MTDISKRIADLPPKKRALLARRLTKKPQARNTQPKVAKSSQESETAPLEVDRSKEATHRSSRHSVASEMRYRIRPAQRKDGDLGFSLFFFTGEGDTESKEKYRLVLESAKFADRHGFDAIWTPERHFHSFGGLYANPSVMSAALAMVTERLELRAGSVVFPLHHPVRVAEEWSIVDNLSQGRIGLAFATGWHPNDFVFTPGQYADRRLFTWEGFDTFRKLWAGEAVEYPCGTGDAVDIKIFPKPTSEYVPLWLTTAGSPESFTKAGELGVAVLTHLLGQDVDSLKENISLYREALESQGYDPKEGYVTVMVHTFLGDDLDEVRETVRPAFCNYLKTFTNLLDDFAKRLKMRAGKEVLTEADWEVLLSHAFDRYYGGAALFGTPKSCLNMIDRLRSSGVDEVACLIDFGVDEDLVLGNLPLIDELKRLSNCEAIPTTVLQQ